MQEQGMPRQVGTPSRQVDRQIDVTGGALRMDEAAIRQQGIGFEDRQRVFNPRRIEQDFPEHKEYVSRTERFETERGAPFQQKRRRKWF